MPERIAPIQVNLADDHTFFREGVAGILAVAEEKGGLGLQDILVRARMIGVKLEITTSPGTGTCYSIQLPINEDHTTHDSPHPGHPGR